MKKTIKNPCYHCYQGKIDTFCFCTYANKDWSKNLDDYYIEIEVPDDKEEAENDERGQDSAKREIVMELNKHS